MGMGQDGAIYFQEFTEAMNPDSTEPIVVCSAQTFRRALLCSPKSLRKPAARTTLTVAVAAGEGIAREEAFKL